MLSHQRSRRRRSKWKGSCRLTKGCCLAVGHTGPCNDCDSFEDHEYEVECIVGEHKDGRRLVVKWKGWPEDLTFETREAMRGSPDVLKMWDAHKAEALKSGKPVDVWA